MLNTEKNGNDIEIMIKRAAKKVFMKKGLAGARLQEIADEAGVGRTAVHYYYRNKENLFSIVWKEFFAEAGQRMAEFGAVEMDIISRLQHFANNYMDHALEDPEIDLFMLNEFNTNPAIMKEVLETSLRTNPADILMMAIEKAVNNGELKGDPGQILMTLMSICMFPFAGISMHKAMMGISHEGYMKMLRERKKFVHDFLETAFKP